METKEFINWGVPISLSVLDNGLTVISVELPSPLVHANLSFTVGALDDGLMPGLAHFLEHILFEGPARDGAHPYFRELIQCGVTPDAVTNWCSTSYYADGLADNAADIITALLRVGFVGHIDRNNIERERRVIIRELADRKKGSETSFNEWQSKLLYPAYPTLSGRPAGTVASVNEISYDDLCFHYSWKYKPSASVLVVSGAIRHDEVIRTVIDCSFIPSRARGISAQRREPINRAIERAAFCSLETSEKTILYFNQLASRDDQIRAGILQDLLTGFPFGMLTQKLRMEEGIVYRIHAGGSGYWFTPFVEITVHADPANFNHIEDELMTCFRRIARGDIPVEAWNTALSRSRIFFAVRPNVGVAQWNEWLLNRWLGGGIEDIDVGKIALESTRDDLAWIAEQILERGRLGRIDIIHS